MVSFYFTEETGQKFGPDFYFVFSYSWKRTVSLYRRRPVPRNFESSFLVARGRVFPAHCRATSEFLKYIGT